MSHITALHARLSAGDFARGQRSDTARAQVDGDFATGQRHASVPRITGNFATGMRTFNFAGEIGDFATGMRAVSIPVNGTALPVEENEQLAA
jgi:hypothetical protein